MTRTNRTYSATKHQRLLFGFAAAIATAATLGVAVVAPTESIARLEAGAYMVAQASVPTEVAILPGTIEVVAHRSRNARNPSPYVPAAYHPHR